MKRTDAFGNDSNRYTEGNPATSVPATVVGASEMNNIQEEICNFIEEQGIALDGGDEEQLIEALNLFVGATANNFGQDFDTTTGLTFGLKSGILRRSNLLVALSASTTALTDDDTNNVYLDTTTSSEAIAATVGAVPAQGIPLYEVVTVSGEITLVTDQRTQIIDVDSLHEADQTDVGARALAEDKELSVKASTTSGTGLLKIKDSVGDVLIFSVESKQGRLVIGQAGGSVRILDSAVAEIANFKDAGTVQFTQYGAGTATFDASGNISSASDSRLKIKTRAFEYGEKEVCQLADMMGFHKWKAISGMETEGEYASFFADEVFTVMPEAAPKNVRYVREEYDTGKKKVVVKAVEAVEASEGVEAVEAVEEVIGPVMGWRDTSEVKSNYHSLDLKPIVMALTQACKDHCGTIASLTERIEALEGN